MRSAIGPPPSNVDARREGRRNARRDHARGDRGDVAVSRTSPATIPAGRALLYKCANAKYAHRLARLDLPDLVRHARAGRGDAASMRSNARWTNLPSRSRSIQCELRLRCYSDRDQNTDTPYTSKQLARMLSPRRRGVRLGQAQPRTRARCATVPNLSVGAWRPASGKPCRCRPPSASC